VKPSAKLKSFVFLGLHAIVTMLEDTMIKMAENMVDGGLGSMGGTAICMPPLPP
jgi:hypothetical protein